MRAEIWLKRALIAGFLVALPYLLPGRAAEGDGVLEMTLELLKSPDRDMRGLGLQEVRDGQRGDAATRQYAELLPALAAEGQIALIEALSERGDRAAKPAVLGNWTSTNEKVRVAVIRALLKLGDATDVRRLAERAAKGTDEERVEARRVLQEMTGSDVDHALLQELRESDAPVRCELLELLGKRRVRRARHAVFERIDDPELSVRVAALSAAKSLAEGEDLPKLFAKLVASEEVERAAAEAAILGVCKRGIPEIGLIQDALKGANDRVRLVAVRALGVLKSRAALELLAEPLRDRTPAVREEAMRLLSDWPDAAAAPYLSRIAAGSDRSIDRVLALRGLIRFARGDDDREPDVELLRRCWNWANRPEEKRLILGSLDGASDRAALDLALEGTQLPDLREEAVLAALNWAERMQKNRSARTDVARALQSVLEHAEDEKVRARARQLQRDMQ